MKRKSNMPLLSSVYERDLLIITIVTLGTWTFKKIRQIRGYFGSSKPTTKRIYNGTNTDAYF